MTSSAQASSCGGTTMPSALAVFRLMANSSLVGNSTGKSAGLLLSGVQYCFDRVLGMRAPDAIHWSYFWNFNPSLL
jgi:hypothetical protein